MSRRFKGRHLKVRANPKARPRPPVKLDDSNSTRDPLQPDCRKPKVLSSRGFVVASSTLEAEAARILKEGNRGS